MIQRNTIDHTSGQCQLIDKGEIDGNDDCFLCLYAKARKMCIEEEG